MSPTKIHGAEQTIGKVFSNDFAFEIADYQRPYAWGTEQAGELLDDLLTALSDDAEQVSIEELNPYFLGSIVLIKSETPQAEVVDGQQRLTTLTILLATLRAFVPEKFSHALTQRLYQEGDPIEGTQNRYRLRPRVRDQTFFQKYVQDLGGIDQLCALDPTPLTDSQRNFRANAALFRERIASLPPTTCIRLLQFIITRCFLVVVSTPDLNSAYRIFSVMNDRGMDLSPTDILKSEVIGAINGDQERAHYAQLWEDEEEDLGRDNFRALFAHIRTIYGKEKLRKTLLEGFRESVKPVANPRHFITDVLKPYSDAYESIATASYKAAYGAEQVNTLFGWLNRIDNFDWTPPALWYLARHRNNPKALIDFFTDLERLAAAMMIMRFSINQRLERYGKVLTALDTGVDLAGAASPLQLSDYERSAVRDVLAGDVYLLLKQRLYILLRLDSALSDGVTYKPGSTITIEHVLPQSVAYNSEWETLFPSIEERFALVHKLGNLALLSMKKNSRAQNYDFATKKQVYFHVGVANFALTIQVLDEPVWTREVIQRRQQALLSTLHTLWRL